MGRQTKDEDFDFSYLQEKKDIMRTKKRNKSNKKRKIEKRQESPEIFKDNEIIIGITKKGQNIKQDQIHHKKKKQNNVKKKKNRKKIKRIIKYFAILLILVSGCLYAMLSPIFQIQEIEVENENIITKEQIISLSEIQLGENIFRINKKETIHKIKQNAYIESVSIKRKFPDKIVISIQERMPTFMLEFGNAYLYLNNQGYILEASNQEIQVPKIKGYKLMAEKCTPGNRLEKDDLEKLEDVLKIMEVAKSNELEDIITQINIEDKQDYIIYLASEEKTVYLGDTSDLTTKMLYLKAILDKEKGKAGEIFLNVNLNTENAYFREQV